jgi:hypothetical protein
MPKSGFTLQININAIHLYGMAKKEFYSQLFKKTIKTDDPEYSAKIMAEALYRLKEYEGKNCSCMICQNSKQKLKEYVEKKFYFKRD